MGERNLKTQAIILSVTAQGENNRSARALSPDLGIFYATLYGGPKSRLRAMVQPFNSGIMYIYNDEARHSKKITDFDAKNCHLSLRTSLYKLWAVNLACELAITTKCAGDSVQTFRLLTAFADGTDASDEDGARLGTIRFLWRYLGLLGVQPPLHECASCGANLLAKNALSYYSPELSSFTCKDCTSHAESKTIYADGDALTYLAAVNELAPGKVRQIKIKEESLYQMKRLVFYLIEKASGTKLRTLETGARIL